MKVVTKCVELLAGKHVARGWASAFQDFGGALQELNPPKQGVSQSSFSRTIAEVQESLGFAFAQREEQTQRWSVIFARSPSQASKGVSSGDER